MTTNPPFVSVVLVNWNGKRFIKKCLGTLLAQDYPNYEVLFVDNKSADDSLAVIRNGFSGDSRLKVLPMAENYGFSKGNNIGFAKAQGKYVIALNTDTEVQPNFITELVRTAEFDETVGSVSCKISALRPHALVWPILHTRRLRGPLLHAKYAAGNSL